MSLFSGERRWASHVAYLDPMVGYGLLIRPRAAQDVADPFADGTDYGTLHDQELYGEVLPELNRLGFEPAVIEGGDVYSEDDWQLEGVTADGRDMVVLYGSEPIVSQPAVEHLAECVAELRRAAGVVGQAAR